MNETAVRHATLTTYVLALGDDALILAQRLAQWVTHAPQIEEDIALANISLDLLGQARTLLGYAGEIEDTGRDEDDLAFLRQESDFRNVQLVEIPNGDFAVTIARQLVFSAYQYELYRALVGSADATLAGLAAKAVKEVAYHRDHARQWTLRLGDGTAESHARMQAGVDRVWPYIEELFESWPVTGELPGVAAEPAPLRQGWAAFVEPVIAEATLCVPQPTWEARGGRQGIHTEHLGHLLPEMQYLHRAHPGASW